MDNELACLWVTSAYRGDHATDVKIAVKPDQDETVQHFADRILGNDENRCDLIEIRIVKVRT